MKEIYLDNSAATAVAPSVIRAITKAAGEVGNPSSFNEAGRRARRLLEDARSEIAAFLHARPDEVVFCASGSEANNLAIIGTLKTTKRRPHAVVSAIEHLSVLEPLKSLKIRTTLIKPDREGNISTEDVMSAVRPNTALVSVMYANNEVGSVQPIKRIARAIREERKRRRSPYPYLHVDACQATAWLSMDVQALGVDLFVFNGAKVHGPHGVAVLFVRRGVLLEPQVRGGDQEFGMRAGTEDVSGAVGLAEALTCVRQSAAIRVAKLRAAFIARLSDIFPDARLNGPQDGNVLPNIINISIPDVGSEELLLELDRHGIRAGSGSACTAHRVEPSHVLIAMGIPRRYLKGTLRFSLSNRTTRQEMERLLQVLPRAVDAIRARRPTRHARRDS